MSQIASQTICLLVGLIAVIPLGGCSGGLPALSPGGYVVQPAHLGQFTSGGSLSTLWYRGSDAHYHYFSHLVKVSTNYRVKRSELTLDSDNEFPLGSKDPVFASPMVARALKEGPGEQGVGGNGEQAR
ncbi:hypothetical protein [Luteolibacter pohnpeiensis]|nr:hypothetical protein [Luteolibacter pohnpeiensis]